MFLWRRSRSCRRRRQRSILAQAQFLPCFGAVGRVKHSGDAFGACHFGDRAKVVTGVEALQVQVFHRPGTPQPQRVDAGTAPADNRRVISNGAHGFVRRPSLDHFPGGIFQCFDAATKADRVRHFRAFEFPWVAEVQPALGLLLLPAIDNRLAKQAVLITNAIPMAGNAQGRHAFHEARRQATQAAVAQCGIGLQQADALKVDTQLRERFTSDFQHAEVAQAVVEQAADEEFQGR